MTKIIKKKDIKGLLKQASKEWSIYVPQKVLGGDIWFEELSKEDKALDRIALGDEDIIISPKGLFFPQSETMFEFDKGKIKETLETSPKLLFGIKPCDLKGVLFADEFFKRNFEDKYYLSRAQDRLIVTIGCLKPPRPSACFCTSAKTGPFSDGGYDLQLVDSGEAYLVEVGSLKGEKFLEKNKAFFKDTQAGADETIGQIKSKAAKALELKVDFEKSLELMKDNKFIPKENYKRISERCLYCGACLYTCPTCTCFNVFDQSKGGKGERCRIWDGCIFSGYTRETSGHNPREEKWIRASRRYEHKLRYDYKVAGTSGCVGCGRCLSSCPVNIGMSKFIQEITEDRSVM
ncbi:MAG: 4Fe-4S dicluster domain-containing protein [Candidatus Omnitrophica bacterium]|nr:4Fe-4S dicluster domain-containing protein [Candidatus Omnitrophota bacterium]